MAAFLIYRCHVFQVISGKYVKKHPLIFKALTKISTSMSFARYVKIYPRQNMSLLYFHKGF
jgi:putative NIF3 family GTP cyclohydrolase 1 type 2